MNDPYESEKTAIAQAVGAVGGLSAMARILQIKAPSVSEWIANGRAPVGRVLAIEKASGVSRYALRPDIFGAAPDTEQQAA